MYSPANGFSISINACDSVSSILIAWTRQSWFLLHPGLASTPTWCVMAAPSPTQQFYPPKDSPNANRANDFMIDNGRIEFPFNLGRTMSVIILSSRAAPWHGHKTFAFAKTTCPVQCQPSSWFFTCFWQCSLLTIHFSQLAPATFKNSVTSASASRVHL